MNESDSLRLRAPAKINLSLEVVGRRSDGYHEIVSVIQTVTLWDELTLRRASGLEFTCSVPGLERDNLVVRAAELLMQQSSSYHGAHMALTKRIPVAAGLGGGSSDGATALIGLSRLWNLNLTGEDLCRPAAELGSDVPFFLTGGTALVEGRGEVVRALPDPALTPYLLVNPGIPVSTARIFRALPASEWTDGRETLGLARNIEDGGRAKFRTNGLQATLFRLYPEARLCYERVSALFPDRTLVSGSGPTVVALVPSEEAGVEARAEMTHFGYGAWLVEGPA